MERPRQRWTIGASMLGLIGVALGLLALTRPNDLSASTQLTFTLTVLLVTTLAARMSAEPWKSYWWGFSVFGWAYLTLSLGPVFVEVTRPWLLTNQIINALWIWFAPEDLKLASSDGVNLLHSPYSCLLWTAHAQFALLHGGLGAGLAYWLRGGRLASNPDPVERPGNHTATGKP